MVELYHSYALQVHGLKPISTTNVNNSNADTEEQKYSNDKVDDKEEWEFKVDSSTPDSTFPREGHGEVEILHRRGGSLRST